MISGGSIINETGLVPITEPLVRTTNDIISSLKTKGLDVWSAELLALPARFRSAERSASKLLEPTSISYPMPRRLLRTTGDVEKYIEEVRNELLSKVESHPVQVS